MTRNRHAGRARELRNEKRKLPNLRLFKFLPPANITTQNFIAMDLSKEPNRPSEPSKLAHSKVRRMVSQDASYNQTAWSQIQGILSYATTCILSGNAQRSQLEQRPQSTTYY